MSFTKEELLTLKQEPKFIDTGEGPVQKIISNRYEMIDKSVMGHDDTAPISFMENYEKSLIIETTETNS